MKKTMLLMLCMLLVASSALAGTMPIELQKLTDNLDLIYVLTEGVKGAEITDVNGVKIIEISLEDETMPNYQLVISHSELFHDKSMEDLTDEEVYAVAVLTAEDSDEYNYEVVTMEDGRKAVFIEYEGESDWVDAFTIIHGYFVQIHGAHADFAPLTEAENDYALTLLDCIDIVESST